MSEAARDVGLTLASHINIPEYNGVKHHQKQQQQQKLVDERGYNPCIFCSFLV